jgi:secreted trypsin-like serine protease
MSTRTVTLRLMMALAVVLTAAGLGAAPASAVAHGTLASPGQDPFAVKLTMTHIPRPDGTFYDSACSAALISPTWIITAGHCFHDVNRNPVSGATPYATTATLNTVDLSQSPGEVRNVTWVQQASNTDIALAKLSAPVSDVKPLGLGKARPSAGSLLTLAGWGATSSINPTPATQLSLGVVKISSVRSTTISVVGYSPYRDTSACLYDSGAPYFSTPAGAPPLLVSVESNGPNCPHTSAETTARVDNIGSWIGTVVLDLPRS